jgi:nucleotide-binding universal stress UspA family protein
MYTRILVPLDGSTMAEQVLAWVQVLAKGLGSGVGLLRVVDPVPQELSNVAHGVYTHQIEDNLKSSAQDYLKDLSDARRTTAFLSQSPSGWETPPIASPVRRPGRQILWSP